MNTPNIPGPFNYHGSILIPARMSNHMRGKVWDEITSIPKFKRCNRLSLGMDK